MRRWALVKTAAAVFAEVDRCPHPHGGRLYRYKDLGRDVGPRGACPNEFTKCIMIDPKRIARCKALLDGNTDMNRMRECELTEVELRDGVPIVSAVMDAIEALVIVLDTAARIVLFNHRCQQATGYSFDEAKGMYLWDLLLPEELEGVRSVFNKLSTGQFPGKHENYWVAKDGTRRFIRWSNTAVLDASGSVKYIIGTGIDITEFKADESEGKATDPA